MRLLLIGAVCLGWISPCLAQEKTESRSTNGSEQAREAESTADVTEPELRDELLEMMEVDQAARRKMIAAMNQARTEGGQEPGGPLRFTGEANRAFKKVIQVDAASRKRMKEIIAKYGWPGKSMVGEKGAHAAWILVQHADKDVEFQTECLKLMTEAPAGEVSGKDVAYLTDRMLMNSGQKQRYGTQLDGDYKPLPVEDPEKLDQRRAEVGLNPIAEYIQQVRDSYENASEEEDDDGDGDDDGDSSPAD